jgi:hypothetical protein
MSLFQAMSDTDPKAKPGGIRQVSEDEVETYPERTGPGGDDAQTPGAVAAESEADGSALPQPGAKPPPLPRRRRLPRPKPVHILGFLALCAVLGLGIGLLWNLVFAPEPEQAAPTTEPEPAAAEPGAAEIRLGEMVVTSEEENGDNAPAGKSSEEP